MEEQSQQQPTPQPEKPKKKFYKRWWFWVLMVIVVIIGGWYLLDFLSDKAGCKIRDKISSKTMIHREGFGCVEAGEDWGKKCISNDDCYGSFSGECNPTGSYEHGKPAVIGKEAVPFKILSEPTVNDEGYVVGTCGAGGSAIQTPTLREDLDEMKTSPFPIIFFY